MNLIYLVRKPEDLAIIPHLKNVVPKELIERFENYRDRYYVWIDDTLIELLYQTKSTQN